MMLPRHKTKIVCTIGPASESLGVMEKMIRAGMNVARLNFSHGDFESHRTVVHNLRTAARSAGRRLAIMADLSGPKMRIGKLAQEPVDLKPGDSFVLTTDDIVGDAGRASVTFKRLPQAVKTGDTLFLNDGIIQLDVSAVKDNEVTCRVVVGGELRSRKGLNLPGINLGISAFTERDHECLKFAAEEGIDAVSQSFVETGADIRAVRQAADALGYHPFIIAKIERSNALDHMDDILDAADGIMIARGDLGVEVPIERIAVIQKDLMKQANRRTKPVITATQMLESMTENRRPTRAEATDVSNAILDGTDCVMLSGESAMGKFPVDAVEMLAKIAAEVEQQRRMISVRDLYQGIDIRNRLKPSHLIAIAVEASLEYASPAAVFVPTRSGATARSLSLFRLPVWTIGISSNEATCQGLVFSSGVYPVFNEDHPKDYTPFVRAWLREHEISGDIAVLTEGPSSKHPEANHRMEMLSGRMGKAGIFRPVVRDEREPDAVVNLIIKRYGIDIPYEKIYGCSYDVAREMLIRDREEDLLKLVMEKYKSLEGEYDLIVCAGSDFTDPSAALEFDINAKIANNLGCAVLPVVKGYGRDTTQVVNAARGLLESLEERKCDLLALVANRVDSSLVDSVTGELRRVMPAAIPAYVLPELPVLEKPTVGEIAAVLGAERLSGREESFNREVRNFKVAAMELPHYLEHIEDGSLIIAPGDRSDIILGSLLADASNTYPHISGIILTGGLKPEPQIKRLIEGLGDSPVPVISVPTDTFTTALNVSSLEGVLSPDNARKISAALGIVEAKVNSDELIGRLSMAHTTRVTPLMFEYEIIQRAKSERRHIVLPEGTEERILRAAEILRMRDVVAVTLLGNQEEIRQKAAALEISLSDMNMIDPLNSARRRTYADAYFQLRKHKGISQQMAFDTIADVSYFGTMMVHFEEADGMVSGSVHTTQHTIRPAFEIIKTKPGFSIVSSVFLMCLSDHVLVFGDCAVNPDPNPEQLADIAISSAETARMFRIDPLIAMLSYSTGESGKGAEVDKVREATKIAKGRRPDLKIEGPIQYDAAVDAGVAKTKLPGSEVAGHATVFIFPDLNTGNNTYKAVQRSANAVAVGPILQGLNKPVNDLSRGCTVTDIVNTVAITAIQSQSGGSTA